MMAGNRKQKEPQHYIKSFTEIQSGSVQSFALGLKQFDCDLKLPLNAESKRVENAFNVVTKTESFYNPWL